MKRWIIGISILLIGLVWGYSSNTYQGKSAKEWAKIAKDNQGQALIWQNIEEKTYIQLQKLRNQPTPSPIVEYRTQYTQQSSTQPKKTIPEPVQYNSYGGTILYGSDGSTCNTYGTNTLYCQ